MKKDQRGFTLIELLISVVLLAVISLVSINIITAVLRSSVKAQMAIDIEQASSFILLKLENDIKNSYSASTPTPLQLTLHQGSSAAPVDVIYTLGSCNVGLNCVFMNRAGLGAIKLTDDTGVLPANLVPTMYAVNVDTTASSFSIITDNAGRPAAVKIVIKLTKPNATNVRIFSAETTLNTVVVLRGSN